MRRGGRWRSFVEIWDVIESECRECRVVVLDCLTLWLNNLMLFERDVESDVSRLLECLDGVKG